MKRNIIVFIASLLLAVTAWSQDEPAGDTEAAEPEETADEVAQSDETELDESGLDEQVYEDADDDFRPSEEISTDQSIAFPTDI